jgi:hypothetical protein
MKKWILGVTALASCAVAACSSSSNGNSPPSDGGGETPDSATASGSSSGGGSSGSGGSGDSGTACTEGTIYTRLGGHAGIRGAVNAIVAAELADPDISTYFFNQVATPIPAGHPNADQIEQCFTDLVASAVGGPGESYPPDGGVTDDAGTFMCRADMTTIHAPLLISSGTFDKFITIAGGVLTSAMVCSADITTLAGALTGTQSAIVSPQYADAGDQPYPGTTTTTEAGAGDGAVEQ